MSFPSRNAKVIFGPSMEDVAAPSSETLGTLFHSTSLHSLLPQDMVRLILSFLDTPKSFAQARQVCREWRDACRDVVWEGTATGDCHMHQGHWDEAARSYQWVLQRVPDFIPAILGLRYQIRATGGHEDHADALLQRACEAPEHIQKEAGLYFERCQQQQSADPARAAYSWLLHGVWMRRVRNDPTQAVPLYHKAAERGNAQAQHNLGYCYANGLGVEENLDAAVMWYRKAASQGLAGAQHNLGLSYLSGHGIPTDYEEAVTWYRRAAEQGHSASQVGLGRCYENGWGVQRDHAMAAKLYQAAAEQDDTIAQYNLASAWYHGRGVERDFEKAAYWYGRASDRGDIDATYNLGCLYFHGRGVPPDRSHAVALWHRTAEHDNQYGVLNLGLCYEHGWGVDVDLEKAREWFLHAADLNAEGAAEGLARLADRNV